LLDRFRGAFHLYRSAFQKAIVCTGDNGFGFGFNHYESTRADKSCLLSQKAEMRRRNFQRQLGTDPIKTGKRHGKKKASTAYNSRGRSR